MAAAAPLRLLAVPPCCRRRAAPGAPTPPPPPHLLLLPLVLLHLVLLQLGAGAHIRVVVACGRRTKRGEAGVEWRTQVKARRARCAHRGGAVEADQGVRGRRGARVRMQSAAAGGWKGGSARGAGGAGGRQRASALHRECTGACGRAEHAAVHARRGGQKPSVQAASLFKLCRGAFDRRPGYSMSVQFVTPP